MGNENNYNYQYPVYPNPVKPMIITTKKVDYFKDEYVDGNITLQNQLPIVLSDIYLNLYLLECWSYKESSDVISGEINKQPLLCIKVGIRNLLKVDSELINLSAGIFNFPFKFKLPNYLQPSFEYPLPDKRGYLRYSLEAKYISPYVQGTTSIYLIVKSRPKVLNTPLSYSSAMNIHKWGLFDQGTTILKVSYLTNNFIISDSIPLKVEINNMRGKLAVTSCEIKLNRNVGYRKKNTDRFQYEINNVINSKLFTVDVQPMNQRIYNYTLEIKDKDIKNFNYINVENPYPHLMDLTYAMPSLDGVILRCDYNISVTLYFESFVTSGYLPKVTLPITLTHQSQEEYNYEKIEDEDLQRAIEASKLEMENNNKENLNNSEQNKKNVNMSVIDKNRMDKMIDKPSGYDMQKMQPVSQSQLIDNDNNALPSQNEIEKNPNNDYNKNNNMRIPNIRPNDINMSNNRNNNMNNINQNNYGNNNMMNANGLQNCPAPAWVNKKNDEDDDLFNPYMNSNVSNDNNNKNNNIIQMSNLIKNNNFSNYNNNFNPNNQNNINNINQINPINNIQQNNFNNNNINRINQNNNINQNDNMNNNYNNNNIDQINNNENNNNINQLNNNGNNHYPNYEENQKNENNNKYPDYNNISNVNNNNNENNISNQNRQEEIKTIKGENDFTLFNESSRENFIDEEE